MEVVLLPHCNTNQFRKADKLNECTHAPMFGLRYFSQVRCKQLTRSASPRRFVLSSPNAACRATARQTRAGSFLYTPCPHCLPAEHPVRAVQPGRPNDSLLIHTITGDKPRMPKTGAPLTTDQVATLRLWIEQGARDDSGGKSEQETWWSLRPLVKPSVPPTAGRTPVDAFIQERLSRAGLAFSPAADRRTLIRRVYYDLHGLPPQPQDIEAFVKDPAPDAYEKLIDRLLDSPRYGERWARHWLDVVHYGDSHGYDKDKPRLNAWPYRDYLIAAFNEDKPYARFIREQIAGDALYPDDPRAFVATGFLAAGPWDFVGHQELREGTSEKDNTRLLDRDDMVATTISTFVSMTAHCARCHNHKFDPIPQTDYYNLQAVFAGIDRADRPFYDDAVAHSQLQQLVRKNSKYSRVFSRCWTKWNSQPVRRSSISTQQFKMLVFRLRISAFPRRLRMLP